MRRMSRGQQIRRIAARVAFFLWIPAVMVPGSYLLARHVLTLPKPASTDPALARALGQLRGADGRNSWLALHVLYGECGCSQRVLAKLLLRGPAPQVEERIVFIGGDDAGPEARARALGYTFERVTREQLVERYHLESAPLFVVADPANRVRYVGGYTDRKQGEVIRDRDVLTKLVQGQDVEPLPTFGCAVSKKLESALNPLGLR
jgi:hypothetical protein